MKARTLILSIAVTLSLVSRAEANTAANVVNGKTDLTAAASFLPATSPTTTSDITFTVGTYTTTAFTLNATKSYGTLDDLSSTPLTIDNKSGSSVTLTLNGGNSTSGSSANDVIYVASGGSLSIGTSSTSALNITLPTTANFDNAGTLNIGSAITVASGKSLSLLGSGNTTLTGNVTVNGGTFSENATSTIGSATIATNTFTINGGTATLAGNNLSHGAITIDGGGSLTLSGLYAAGNGGNFKLGGGTGANYGGGAFTYNGTVAQYFNGGATFNAGSSTVNNTNTGQDRLNVITRNVGSAVDFNVSSGSITTATANATGTGNANFTGGQQTIIGGYATWSAGSTWAVSGSAGTAGTISGLSTYSAGFAAGKDVDVAANTTSPASMTVNSIRFNNSAGSTVNLGGALTVATGGILETFNVGSHNDSINNSTITSFNGADLIVIQGNTNGSLTIGSAIIDNSINTSSTVVGLTKSGAGLLNVSGANTYTGNTYVDAGTLEFSNVGAFYSSTTGGVTTASAAKVLVSNGATLALAVGTASGSFNASDVANVLAGSSGTTFAPGASIGFDTTNAGSGGFTYSSAIANSNNGALGLVKLGSNALYLTNPTGSTYSNGTTISAGTLYANNTGNTAYSAPSTTTRTITAANASNSATGSGAVTVNNGGTLGGSGTIASSGVTIKGGGTLFSGVPQTTAPSVTGNGLTLNNTPTTIGSLTGTANLTFALGSGNPNGTGPAAYSTPNSSTTFLSLTGGSTMNFTTGSLVSVSLIDLTNGNLALRDNNPYLLVQAGSDADYTGLVTRNADGTLALNSNGYVMGVYISGTDSSSYTYNPITLTQFGADGVTQLGQGAYASDPGYIAPQLYLYNGDLEVVPEPGTWAMMLGGFLLLVFCQRSREANRRERLTSQTTKL